MKKIFKNPTKAILLASIFIGAIMLATTILSCDALQDSLHDEMQKKMDEDTGIATIAGDVWYFNGTEETNLAGTVGANLAIDFNKKVLIAATDDNKSKLSGSMSITYTSSGGTQSETHAISAGKIMLSDGTEEDVGSLTTSGKQFRLNMTPVVKLLNGKKANNNELSVELKLSGFVSAEGSQKGRSVGILEKKFKVKPLYSKVSMINGVDISTQSSTKRKIVIPVEGILSLTSDAKVTNLDFSDSSYNSMNFTVGVTEDGKGITLLSARELQGKNLTGKITISGIVPALNASSYEQKFILNYSNMKITEDSLEADGNANSSSSTGATFDISKMGVYDDANNLYVVLTFSNPPTFWNKDLITILIDNESVTTGNVATTTAGLASSKKYGIGSKVAFAEGSSVECEVVTCVAEGVVSTYSKKVGSGEATLSPSSVSYAEYMNKFSALTLTYTIPFTMANISKGNKVYVYAAVSHHNDTSDSHMSIADHIPTAATKNADGTDVVSSWANDGSSYVIDMKKAFAYTRE